MSLAARLLAGLVSLLVAFGAGWGAAIKYTNGKQAQEALDTSEALRESERLAARNITRIGDALTQDRISTERTARATADRLRKLAESRPADQAGCASRSDDTSPAAWALSDNARTDLVALAAEAEAVSDRLRACQALITPSP